jgi:rhamnulokinase
MPSKRATKPEIKVYLAIDLGAESGRVIAGLWNGKTIRTDELHRFPNRPVRRNGGLHWNMPELWREIQKGLAIAAKKYRGKIVSVGADTWAVDYVLLDKNDKVLGLPFQYRDARTNDMMDKAFRRVSREKIFAHSGLQFLQFNTLYQLLAERQRKPSLLDKAACILLIPDFLHWQLCGSKAAEFTNASTTQCVDPFTRRWSDALLKEFRLPRKIFPRIVPPGTNLGTLRDNVAKRTGLGGISVVAPPTHDTASAVAGVPTANTGKTNWAYISSGTWSLMGVETQYALLSERTLKLNMTNEGGVDGTFRLLKNIMGLWVVQQCKTSFGKKGKKYTYAQLAQLAARAKPLQSIVNLNDSRFFNPPDMVQAIQDYCRETRQPVPATVGELIRCAYESLALMYRDVLGSLEELTGKTVKVIHIVGGGSQNQVLNQFTADACQRSVAAGPVEATALGNLLMQVRASGELASLAETRDVIRKSSDVQWYRPGPAGKWNQAAARFAALLKNRHLK